MPEFIEKELTIEKKELILQFSQRISFCKYSGRMCPENRPIFLFEFLR